MKNKLRLTFEEFPVSNWDGCILQMAFYGVAKTV